MNRVGGLWEKVVSFENRNEAARRATVGKRKPPDAAAFPMNHCRLAGHDARLVEARPAPGYPSNNPSATGIRVSGPTRDGVFRVYQSI
jgi:hypothetical protein